MQYVDLCSHAYYTKLAIHVNYILMQHRKEGYNDEKYFLNLAKLSRLIAE